MTNLINRNINQIRNRGSPTYLYSNKFIIMKVYKSNFLNEIQINLIISIYLKILGK